MPQFTPPGALLNPPFDADATPAQQRLWRHFNSQPVGINVFQLQDGTFVQDYPTAENDNTAIPYPILLDPNDPYSVVYGAVHGNTQDVTETHVQNPVVRIFYGSHTYQIDTETAALLTAAGYGDQVS